MVEKLGFDSVEVMKTLSVRGNSPRDKRQFRAKTMHGEYLNQS